MSNLNKIYFPIISGGGIGSVDVARSDAAANQLLGIVVGGVVLVLVLVSSLSYLGVSKFLILSQFHV